MNPKTMELATRGPRSTSPELRRRLDARLEANVLTAARRAGQALPVLAVFDPPERPVIWRSELRSWLVAPPAQDPTAAEFEGKIPIPAAQRVELECLAEHGVECDVIAVAHELPEDWKAGERLLPDPEPLRHRRGQLDRVIDGGLGAARASASATRVIAPKLAVAAATVAGAAAIAAAPAIALAGLDPIVLGGVRVDERVLWCELVRWNW